MADPIQILSLDALVEEIDNPAWSEIMMMNADEGESPYLELSADAFHKDNISGGPAYALQITKNKSIDSLMINEPNNTTFIDYLRICFEYCGFPGLAHYSDNNSRSFLAKIRPQLQEI